MKNRTKANPINFSLPREEMVLMTSLITVQPLQLLMSP